MSVTEVTELPQWTMNTNEKREASYVRVWRVTIAYPTTDPAKVWLAIEAIGSGFVMVCGDSNG